LTTGGWQLSVEVEGGTTAALELEEADGPEGPWQRPPEVTIQSGQSAGSFEVIIPPRARSQGFFRVVAR
jgi:hypothetical protein